MTDRYRRLTVTLTRDTRDDDCEPIISAIMMIKGVAGVKGHVVDVPELLARETVARAVESDLLRAVQCILTGQPYTFEPKK